MRPGVWSPCLPPTEVRRPHPKASYNRLRAYMYGAGRRGATAWMRAAGLSAKVRGKRPMRAVRVMRLQPLRAILGYLRRPRGASGRVIDRLA